VLGVDAYIDRTSVAGPLVIRGEPNHALKEAVLAVA